MPFPLRFPLAFDGKLLGQVLRLFTDTVASNYRKRMAERGIPDGECGAVAVIQRANSDLRLSPHYHVLPCCPETHRPAASEDIPTTFVRKSGLLDIIEVFVGGVHVCVLGLL
jgi:hypothetical protein